MKQKEIQYNFYILKSVDLIEEYKKILNQPVKISFLGKNVYQRIAIVGAGPVANFILAILWISFHIC